MNCFGKYRTDAMLLASLVMLEVKDTYININMKIQIPKG